MTTSNAIITKSIEEALYVPLESLHSEFDSITYVFVKDGINTTKQEVMIGDANSNEVVILAGLSADDRIFLSNVPGMENEEIVLIPEMDGKRNMPKEEEQEPLEGPDFAKGHSEVKSSQ